MTTITDCTRCGNPVDPSDRQPCETGGLCTAAPEWDFSRHADGTERGNHPPAARTGLELEASTWPRYTLDGRKMTQTAARKALEPYGERIRWATHDRLDPDDVGAARWVAEELEQDGTPYQWTYRGDDRAELEAAIVTWALTEADEPRGVGGRNWIRITDRLA